MVSRKKKDKKEKQIQKKETVMQSIVGRTI